MLLTSELLFEIVHGKNAGYITGVISEEDTAKGSEDTEKVAAEGDRRLDPTQVGAALAAIRRWGPAGHDAQSVKLGMRRQGMLGSYAGQRGLRVGNVVVRLGMRRKAGLECVVQRGVYIVVARCGVCPANEPDERRERPAQCFAVRVSKHRDVVKGQKPKSLLPEPAGLGRGVKQASIAFCGEIHINAFR